MRVLVFTMAYNESENIERWSNYYKSQLGNDSILIIDNASNDESVDFVRSQRNILYPKMIFSNNLRASFCSSIANSFLLLYDVVIYTDSDEFIVANPEKYGNLLEFLEINTDPCYTGLGFNVIHLRNEEEECPPEAPFLQYRRHIKPVRAMCKTLVTRRPIRWGGGFHTSDAAPNFHEDLWVFHTKNANYGQRLRRQAITRSVIRDDKSGGHQRVDDAELDRMFEKFCHMERAPFNEAARRVLVEHFKSNIDRIYNFADDTVRYNIHKSKALSNMLYVLDSGFPKIM